MIRSPLRLETDRLWSKLDLDWDGLSASRMVGVGILSLGRVFGSGRDE